MPASTVSAHRSAHMNSPKHTESEWVFTVQVPLVLTLCIDEALKHLQWTVLPLRPL